MVAVMQETVERPIGPLLAAVDAVSRECLDGRSAVVLGQDLVAIRRAIDRLEAETTRRLRPFALARGHVADGCASLVAWLRERCGLSAGGAAARAEVADQLSVLPAADELFSAGVIGLDHARVLARTVVEVGPEAARAATADLVDAARTLHPTQLREVSRRLRFMVDPTGADAQAERVYARRSLSISSVSDGACLIEGQLDAEGGARLRIALDSLSMPVPGDVRTGRQRRADALVELASRQLQSGTLPMTRSQRPHLLLTTTRDYLGGAEGAAPAELSSAGSIARATAQRLACDAAVSEVTVDNRGEPLAVGRTRRTVPGPMRRALVARDRGCCFPTCDRPPEWTDAHHLAFWTRDQGPTELDNLALVCRFHHRLLHEGGWTLDRDPDGRITARPP
jgi:hypothetical protein